jgi:FAD/FMN-containing dehydrogenase
VTSAKDVSDAVKILAPRCCKFAVRGGGHNAIGGIANIQNGVTIDLGGLSSVVLAADKKTVAIGAGQTWGGVYTQLAASNLAVPGGRHGPVGVGGSTLGGQHLAPVLTLEERN